jgi:hypothetical protein
MEKKLITICSIILFIAGTASASVTVYDQDRPGWESAVGIYEEEFFTDATLNPGVSVVSTYPGYVDTIKGVWWDRLVVPGYGTPTTTTWQFASPVVGFGANWNPGIPGGPGANIEVKFNGSWTLVGEVPNNYTGQFWGFVSTTQFSSVRLASGSAGGAWCETYEMDNMVYSINHPPDCSNAYADPAVLWPPNHKMVAVSILGVTDPDGDPVSITITSITSDEPTASDEGAGGAKHAPDATGVGTDTAQLRAERSGDGNGRVYEISFTASDGRGGECECSVLVCVPHDQADGCIDDGQIYDATQIN